MRFNRLADVPENIRDKVGKKMIAQEKSKVKYRNQPTTVMTHFLPVSLSITG